MRRTPAPRQGVVRPPADDPVDAPGAPDNGPAGIQSFGIGLKLLSLMAELSDGDMPPMIETLSAAADMPPAKVHRYMASLLRSGYAERDPATISTRVGQVMPRLESATGRVFGAWLPPRMVERLIQQELAAAAAWRHQVRSPGPPSTRPRCVRCLPSLCVMT